MEKNVEFSVLKGKVLTNIQNIGNEELIFTTTDGEIYMMYHWQDCCECVYIDDICGDLNDLLGEPILVAELVNNEQDTIPDGLENKGDESFTWTFYKLDTRKGGVTIRWYGTSNGFYSEKVDFVHVNSPQ